MKKIFILAVVAGAFTMTSCKKDWTCECKTSTGTISATIPFSKITKKDAKAACDVYNASATASGGSCSLK